MTLDELIFELNLLKANSWCRGAEDVVFSINGGDNLRIVHSVYQQQALRPAESPNWYSYADFEDCPEEYELFKCGDYSIVVLSAMKD